MTSPLPRVRVYIDGFNVYYRALRGSGYKWVDFDALARRLMPGHDVGRIVYCTARVSASDWDPTVHVRQDTFFRALVSHCPDFEIVEGRFRTNKVKGLRVPSSGCSCCAGTASTCACCTGPLAQIEKPEEKGSDVNLAVRLVRDGFMNEYDTALVLSNDSDIQPAVDIVRGELGKQVVVCNPAAGRPHSLVGTSKRSLRPAAIQASQMPNPVTDSTGRQIYKPTTW